MQGQKPGIPAAGRNGYNDRWNVGVEVIMVGRPRKYRWEEWFGRPLTVLVNGLDYHCSQSTMSQMVRNNASQRGLRVRVTDTGDTIIIEVVGEVQHTDKAAVVG